MKRSGLVSLVSAFILAISFNAFASVRQETVKWPTDKDYDANIFVAEATPQLKQAYDEAYISRTADDATGSGATGDVLSDFEDTYKQYYTDIQPVDYLKLGGTTILQDPIPAYVNSSHEAIGVWNLPILKDGFYYQLAANDWITMPDYTYPVLVLKQKPEEGTNAKVYLRMYSRKAGNTSTAVAQFVITIPWSLTCGEESDPRMSDAGTLEVAQAVAQTTPTNIHAWAFNYSGTFRPYHTRFAVFGEDYVVALTEEPSDYQYYLLDEDRSLIFSRKTSEQTQIMYFGDTIVFDKGFINVAGMTDSLPDQDFTKDLDIDVLNMFRDEGDQRITYAIGPKQDIITGNVNSTHSSWHVRTKAGNQYEREHGAMAAFFNKTRCHIIVYYPGSISDPYKDMYDVPSENRIYPEKDQVYSLRQETGDYFLSLVVDNPNTKLVSENDIKDDAETTSLKYLKDNYTYAATSAGEPGIKVTDKLKYYHNLAAISFWNAWQPTVGAIDSYDKDKTYTIQLDPNGGTVNPTSIQIVSTNHEHINLPTPTKENNKFLRWVWADTNTTFDEYNFNPEVGQTYKLKAEWQELPGEFWITFINDLKNTQDRRHFYINDDIDLPAVTGDSKHTFKNWLILDDEGQVHSIYNPTTFNPEKNKEYRFMTNWDSRGVITDILVRKNQFLVNETISPNSIRVTVTDDYGNTRVLGSEEYAISPNKYDTPGWKQPTVMYTAGNATATFDVEIKEDKIKTLTAKYSGRALPVGTKLDPDLFDVEVIWESGREQSSNDETDPLKFSLTPQKVLKEGSNKINITVAGKTTNVTVEGKKGSDPELTSPSKANDDNIEEITATAREGLKLSPGAPISKSDFEVKRIYEDGTQDIIPTSNFMIYPVVASQGPTTTVTVYYEGFTTTVDVPTGDGGENILTENYRSDEYESYDNENFDPDSMDGTLSYSNGYDDGLSDDTSNDSNNAGSPYYLHGRNIFDDFMSFGSSQPMNEVDIEEILNSLPSGTEEHTIDLINTSIGDQLTPSMLSHIKDMNTVIHLDMKDDIGNKLLTWTLDPKNMDDTDIQSDFDPNVLVSKYPRTTDEVIVGYSVNNYPKYASLSVNLAPHGIDPDSTVEYYKLDIADWTPMENTIHNPIQTGELGQIYSPDTYFAVTTKTDEFYPDDYNLWNEYPFPSDQAAMLVTDEQLQQEQQEDVNTEQTEFSQPEQFSNPSQQEVLHESLMDRLRLPLILLGGVLVLVGAGVALFINLRRRRTMPVRTAQTDYDEDFEEEEDLEEEEEDFEEEEGDFEEEDDILEEEDE